MFWCVVSLSIFTSCAERKIQLVRDKRGATSEPKLVKAVLKKTRRALTSAMLNEKIRLRAVVG